MQSMNGERGSPSSRIHEDTAAMPRGSSVPRDECSSKVQA